MVYSELGKGHQLSQYMGTRGSLPSQNVQALVSPFSMWNTANVGLELTFGHKITLPRWNIKNKQKVLSVEWMVLLHLWGFYFLLQWKSWKLSVTLAHPEMNFYSGFPSSNVNKWKKSNYLKSIFMMCKCISPSPLLLGFRWLFLFAGMREDQCMMPGHSWTYKTDGADMPGSPSLWQRPHGCGSLGGGNCDLPNVVCVVFLFWIGLWGFFFVCGGVVLFCFSLNLCSWSPVI